MISRIIRSLGLTQDKTRQKQLKKKFLLELYSICLLLIGGVNLELLAVKHPLAVVYQEPQAIEISLTSSPSAEVKYFTLPKHLRIGEIVDQPVDQFDYSPQGMPVVSNDHVSHLIDSARPGEKGNMILYGHNLNNILGKLRFTKVGDTVEVTNEQGEILKYQVTQVETVNTDETHWLQQTDKAVVTIYTCIGWMDSQRLVVRGELIQ